MRYSCELLHRIVEPKDFILAHDIRHFQFVVEQIFSGIYSMAVKILDFPVTIVA